MKPLTLITGGSGFVGRHVVAALARNGFLIRAVVRSGKQHALPQGIDYESVVESPDIFNENTEWWQTACRDVDTLIHLAWYAEPGYYLTSPLNVPCLTGTCSLAAGAIDAGVRRIVGVGTCFEYDVSQCYLSTKTPLRPTTLYAATKTAAFLTLSQMCQNAEVSFAWCRLFYLFGEGENPRRLVPYVRTQLAAHKQVDLTHGNQIRDFLDVAIAACQIVEIASSDITGPVNVCSGKPCTVRQFVESIADETGDRHLLRFGARQENLVDPPCVVGVPLGSSRQV
jgi:dTDP-6-deoxy-L-talose 4-dehydrogenase (NAD+)